MRQCPRNSCALGLGCVRETVAVNCMVARMVLLRRLDVELPDKRIAARDSVSPRRAGAMFGVGSRISTDRVFFCFERIDF